MGRLGTAIRSFFRCLGDGQIADRVAATLDGKPPPAVARPAADAPKPGSAPLRSDALTLLAALQREARLVDFLQEPIAAYSDAQIGAAVREVHRSSAALLQRFFALQPVMSEGEGASVEVAGSADGGRVQFTGNVTGQPPYRGTLRHAGWQATLVNLPQWTGGESAARIVAPAEVEIR
jgi:hypothetical protein